MGLHFSEEGRPILTSSSSKSAKLDSLDYWSIGVSESYQMLNRKGDKLGLASVDSIDYFMDKPASYDAAAAQPDLKYSSIALPAATYQGNSL